ncbi:MAG: cytidylate kinase-like family protein [Clostridiaceae bacterium]|nr:cytidylate kinase-like family protein [Clostridiaceae bacterium]MDD5797756.1 cytidylate kinase-like family protein [Clostridiaceae bacterium]MDY4547327.1 cytidylate kinase-like family protein [Candidatus Choladocola sp.]
MEDKKYFTICITRTCGSGGTTIAKKLADAYGIDLYDRKLLRLASEDSGISEAMFAQADEDVKNSLLYKVSRKVYNGELIPPESGNFVSDQNLFNYQAKVLKELSERESYVVVGRCADYILRNHANAISVYLYASKEECLRHEMEYMGYTQGQAMKEIKRMDRYRRDYYVYHTGRKWKNPENYDLCLNTEKLGYEGTKEFIMDYVKRRMELQK